MSSQDSAAAEIKVVSPEVTEVLFLDMKLDVFPTRLVLETLDASRAEKVQDVALNILAKLPHTPITACGLNNTIQFDLADQEYWHKIGHTLAPKELIWNNVLENPGMALLSVKGVLPGNFPGEINVNVAPSRKFVHGLLVASNFHYPVPPDAKRTPRSEEVPRYIQQTWKPALAKTREVAEQIFEKIKK